MSLESASKSGEGIAPGIESPLSQSADELLVGADSEIEPTLSVVMPTLNEEAGIRTCIERVKAAIETLGVPAEIIISDSSTDRTPEIARELGAIVVEPDESGYGYAYRYAFERVRGEYVVIGDADCTYDFEELPRLLEPVRRGEADICLGSRLEGEIKPGAMPALHQYVGNPLLTAFLNVFYDAGVSDAHSGFRVLSRETLGALDLQSDGMEFASEMIMDASEKGLRIVEVPITYHEREGEATLDSFRDGWRHVKFMLMNAPGYLFTGPGIGLGIVGVALMAASLLEGTVDDVYFGVHMSIIGGLLTILGYQIGSLSVFSSVATEPIREPQDPVTEWIDDNFRLEHGTTLGICAFCLSAVVIGWMGWVWIASGRTRPPMPASLMIVATVLILSVQTVFYSFFLSMLGEKRA